jgi:AcrR family transcriptional regulator
VVRLKPTIDASLTKWRFSCAHAEQSSASAAVTSTLLSAAALINNDREGTALARSAIHGLKATIRSVFLSSMNTRGAGQSGRVFRHMNQRQERMRKKNRDRVASATTSRPRGADATVSILRAALELGEEVGFDALTIERIAGRTGVAKTTIYRRWPNVSAIVMDAFLTEVTKAATIRERATARESFSVSMKLLARAYRGQLGKIMRALLGHAQVDDRLLEAVKIRWVEPRRQIAREIVRRGIKNGELRPGLDPDVVLDILYGAIYHRILVPYVNSETSDAYIDAVIDSVFGGLALKPR